MNRPERRWWIVVVGLLALLSGQLFTAVGQAPERSLLPVVLHEPPTPVPTATPTKAPTATPRPTETPKPTATPTRDPNQCSPAYPTVCIPPPPPDLDCGDIPYRRFTVLPPDPHNFDSDGDGIGCESG